MNLSTIQNPTGLFTIAPFDHRGSLAKMFDLEIQQPAVQHAVTQLKVMFMEAFSPICSGVLVDPEYGFPAIARKADSCGLILTLENSDYSGDRSAVPTLVPNWGVHQVKSNYAVAKLLIYYHPQEANALEKKKLVIELYHSCQYEGISFLVEPVIYNPNGKEELAKADFQAAQLQTAQEFQNYCDVLKIQYPGDALACATMTAELDIPWILLSRGMKYDPFADALRVCMENGAKGFAAGRSVWQEIGQYRMPDGMPDYEKIQHFLQTTALDRMNQLIQITSKYA
jgi:tagatose-1,6-bisphosphate aldolase